MIRAGAALQAALIEALRAVPGIGAVNDGAPAQAAFPHALIDGGVETDWGHKSGAGREVRIAITLRDGGERPCRAQRLMAAAETAALGVAAAEGWRIVTLRAGSSRLLRDRQGWAGVIELRARMLAD